MGRNATARSPRCAPGAGGDSCSRGDYTGSAFSLVAVRKRRLDLLDGISNWHCRIRCPDQAPTLAFPRDGRFCKPEKSNRRVLRKTAPIVGSTNASRAAPPHTPPTRSGAIRRDRTLLNYLDRIVRVREFVHNSKVEASQHKTTAIRRQMPSASARFYSVAKTSPHISRHHSPSSGQIRCSSDPASCRPHSSLRARPVNRQHNAAPP